MGLSASIFIRTASNFALAAVSIDRLYAILRPSKYTSKTKFCSEILIQACWIVALIIGSNTMLVPAPGMKSTVCKFNSSIRNYYILIYCFFGKILPLIIIVVAYGIIFRKIREVKFNFRKENFYNLRTLKINHFLTQMSVYLF